MYYRLAALDWIILPEVFLLYGTCSGLAVSVALRFLPDLKK